MDDPLTFKHNQRVFTEIWSEIWTVLANTFNQVLFVALRSFKLLWKPPARKTGFFEKVFLRQLKKGGSNIGHFAVAASCSYIWFQLIDSCFFIELSYDVVSSGYVRKVQSFSSIYQEFSVSQPFLPRGTLGQLYQSLAAPLDVKIGLKIIKSDYWQHPWHYLTAP